MRFSGFVIAILLAAGSARAHSDPWAAMAQRDLTAIHDVLRANHPGAVDNENRAFANRLESGLHDARQEAAHARTYYDYRRALRRYITGFRDLHTGLSFNLTDGQFVWPGFLVVAGDDGAPRVGYSADAAVPRGARVLECDGKNTEALVREWIDPYFGNPDIPHMRQLYFSRLFRLPVFDTHRLSNCRFEGQTAAHALTWQVVSDADYNNRLHDATPLVPPMGVRQVGDTWYINIPSLVDHAPADLATLVDEISAHAAVMRTAPRIVFDVRNNGGGDSAWVARIIAALWGEDMAHAVDTNVSAGEYVEFRASPLNRAAWLRRAQTAELPEVASYSRDAVAAIDAAMAQHRPLALSPQDSPHSEHITLPTNLVHGRVYVLMSGGASACLDLIDALKTIPNVTLIGLPTLADSLYIDIFDPIPLPSGLAGIYYSSKVYRHRLRANNQWYEPQIRWPGGAMTEESVDRWIATLP
jgi:peptidase S41-like protein